METSAFELLVVPTLWVTFGSIVAGAALLSLIQTAEVVLQICGGSKRCSFEGSPAGPPTRLGRARPVKRGAVRFHG
jgi:hypothetical protein